MNNKNSKTVKTTNQTTNLAYRILVPVALVLGLLLAIGTATSQQQLRVAIEEHVSQQVAGFSSEIRAEIEHKTGYLESMLLLLIENRALREAFEARDKSRLLQISEPLFESVLSRNHISHFYFTDTDRVNFLRVHEAERSGDSVNRLTTVAAEQSGSITTGIELGPLGTLTLRSVAPWYDSAGNRLGYIELGIDSSFFLKESSELHQVGLALAVRKELLDRESWEQGQALFGHASNWDRFEDHVIARESGIPDELQGQIAKRGLELRQLDDRSVAPVFNRTRYRWQSRPIESFGGQHIGNLLVAVEVTDWIRNYYSIALRTIVVYLSVSIVLLLLMWRFLRRLQTAEGELHQSLEQLHQMASFDQLTRLPNRQLFVTELEQRIKESSRFDQPFAICFIDLDNFKNVNDSLGHGEGDILLRELGRSLKQSLREYDVLSRFGGDEFVLLLPHTGPDEAVVVANKLLQSSNRPFSLDGGAEVHVTLSIGISVYPQDGNDRDTLLRHADAAMYQAKDAGKNCFRFFTSSINESLQRQRSIESRLRHAIERDELQLYYQPQFDLKSGRLFACEALLRWLPREGEQVSPAEFIPVAEKTLLINEIGNWVFEEACRQRREWADMGLDIRIDVNLSGRQLVYQDIYQYVSEKLDRHGLQFSDIGIELTENTLIEAEESLIEGMSRLVESGTAIAIDDFGTGYSSLSYLKKFPVTTVKIDQAFVRDAPGDPSDRAIMAAIVAMGHSLDLRITVEGIETPEHERIARDLGCDRAQGFYYARPGPASELDLGHVIRLVSV